jgi:hypothetical protein
VPGGTAALADGKLTSASFDSKAAEQVMPVKVAQFAVPAGMSMVQVSGTPSAAAPWGAASEPDKYELVDAAMKRYQPYGLLVRYDAKGAERLYLHYVSSTTIDSQTPPEGAGMPKQVILLYLVPANTAVTEFDDHGQKAHDLSVTAK